MNKRVIVKAGIHETKLENKYKLGIILREETQNNIKGYIVQVDNKEEFYYWPQVFLLEDFKEQIQTMLNSLLTMEKAGIDVEEAFKSLVELQEELS